MPPDGVKDIRAYLNSLELDLSDTESCTAAGQKLLDVLCANATEETPRAVEDVSSNYQASSSGLVYMKPSSDGVTPILLTNFTAEITADIVRDDGQETSHLFEIEAKRCSTDGKPIRFCVPASRFPTMNWPCEHLGASAVIYPGYSTRDHTRAAIQLLSQPRQRRVHTHTGWTKLDKFGWVYLHGNGAIGKNGMIRAVETEFSNSLRHFVLPEPPTGEELRNCVRASLGILELGAHRITMPLFASTYRSALGPSDFSTAMCGPTGVFKTELATAGQGHFGSGFNSRELPGSFSSTGNALEAQAFLMKDALFVVDDFAPTGSPFDVARYHREADRILRAQGNNSSRGRLRADGELRPGKAPRGLTMMTGEDVPRGLSLRSRTFIVEIEDGDIDADKLTNAQGDAANGLYAGAMAGFLQCVACRYDQLVLGKRARLLELRTEAAKRGLHRRTPEIIANLIYAVEVFGRFAVDIGAIGEDELAALVGNAWKALGECGAKQAAHMQDAEPARRFIELLNSAIASGEAHIAARSGSEPNCDDEPNAWGWRLKTIGTGSYQRDEWQPQGKRIGWVDESGVFIDSGAAFKVAEHMAGAAQSLGITESTLKKRLNQGGYLASTDLSRQRLTIRQTVEGVRREVLHMPISVFGVFDSGRRASNSGGQTPHLETGTVFGDGFRGGNGKLSQPEPQFQREKQVIGTGGTVGTENAEEEASRSEEIGEWTG